MRKVKIPEKRVGAVIGEDGDTKQKIEERTETDLSIKDNTVSVEGQGIGPMDATKIVKAIGRGFESEKALKIARQDYSLHLMDVEDFASTSNSIDRLKGRVIGRDGEAKRHIEKEAKVDISIHGTTIGIVGGLSNIEVASKVVKNLLNGRSHSTAYKVLKRNQAKVI
jgi:ribosomal RNA assembly protein